DIARLHNPVLRGWMAYYGRFYPSAMYPVLTHFDRTLVAWAMRKYKRLKRHKILASLFLESIAERHPDLFVHWRKGAVGRLACWERGESRGSRTVLGEGRGEIPPA